MTDPQNGLRAKAEQLRELVKANELPRTPTTDRVQQVANELARITEQHLDTADPLLASAKDNAETAKPDAKKLTEQLNQTAKLQQSAQESLDTLLKRLEQWGDAGELRAESRLLKEQLAKANAAAEKAAAKIEPGKAAIDLTPTEKREMARAADKFQQLADQSAGVLNKTESFAKKKEELAAQRKAEAEKKEAEGTPESNAEAARLRKEAEQAQAEADALAKQFKLRKAKAS